MEANQGLPPKEKPMNKQTTNQISGLNQTAPYTPRFACLAAGSIQAHSKLAGETIHCTSGHLWVTIEEDGMDHILSAGKSVAIPNTGKVIISGPGCYQITQNGPDTLEMRRAS
jgi:quercetin dioxygenase-like cupin family protein